MAFLAKAATPTCLVFLCGLETLATPEFECGFETLASSAFLYGEETPRAVALLKGSDREILSCRVHFVAKIAEKVRIVISASGGPDLSGKYSMWEVGG